uniref:Sperm-associated antigen 1 n=1 Tax=Varanus komodoensis TaxID=61221 RepID=A0A8D2L3P9_VARKO
MGNAQKKFPSKGDGSKSEHKEAQKHRDPSESKARKGTPDKKTHKVVQNCEREGNGSLSNGRNNSENKEVKPKDAESSSAGICSSTLLPTTAAKLKAEGNELFKNGQFGDAVLRYTEAIENVVRIQSPEDLSILYSNRAACYLKEGNSVDCIQDCNSALELQPYSLKPLLRRALAYESMERYRQAYVDYKTVLQIDSGIQAANDNVNRLTRTLIDQDGPNWREKLPPIPVVPVSAQFYLHSSNTDSVETTRGHAPCENPEEKFKDLKNKGNEFVKKGNYEEALKKYSECMKLNSQELTIYTNRALCCLKLFQYEEAKKDCDYVLQTDDSNIKALYRRALANKGLEVSKESSLEHLSGYQERCPGCLP